MKRIFITFLSAAVSMFVANKAAAQSENIVQPKFVQITTIESVVNGGLDRSTMILTKEDGSQEERALHNLFSITGINFKNIRENENSIIQTLKSYTDNGWKLMPTMPLILSPGNNGSGIFMTRYLLSK